MGAFLFLRKVAEGPATEVFLVHQDGSPGRRAVELLRSELVDQPELVGRFLGEAELRIRESDSRLLAWAEVGRTPEEGRPFLLSEPLPAEGLRTWLLKHGALSVGQAMALGVFLCQALRARGPQPHGKLFPEGILFESPETLASAKLLDFGLTLSPLSSDRPPAWLPPEYRAPEVLKGLPLTERSDVYGVGLILWEALTGTSPVRGLTPEETTRRQLERETPRLPDRAAALEPIVSRCLAKAPEDRWTSVWELEGALTRALAVEALHATSKRFTDEEEALSDLRVPPLPALPAPSPPAASPPEVPPQTNLRGILGGSRLLTVVLCACLLWTTAAVPRHLAPLEPTSVARALPAREPLSLRSYAESCEPGPGAPGKSGLELRPSVKRLLWTQLQRGRRLGVRDEQTGRCEWRAEWLAGQTGHGHRPAPR